MNSGLNNFKPHRLEQALDFLMLSRSTFAGLSGVKTPVLSRVINGQPPSAETFKKIHETLKFPPTYFLKEEMVKPSPEKFWRSLNSAKKAARSKGNTALIWQTEIWQKFHEDFPLPKYDLKNLEYDGDPLSDLTEEEIEDISIRFREKISNKNGPIKSMIRAMELNGIVVGAINLEVEKIDGVSSRFDGVHNVLLNTFKQSSARSRFDAAHELGHLLLHRNVTMEHYADPTLFHAIEGQANSFASALLLPEQSFVRDVWAPTLDCFKDLKKKWNVSIQAMMRRCLNLKIITPSIYQNLNIGISKNRWRFREPLDNETPLERPRLFEKCVEEYLKGGLEKDDILSKVSLPPEVATQLLGLETDFFESDQQDEDVNIIRFRP